MIIGLKLIQDYFLEKGPRLEIYIHSTLLLFFNTTKTYVYYSMIYTTIKIMSSPLFTKNTIYFIINQLLAIIGSIQPHLCIFSFNVS